jgi:hypothetical protein
MLTVMTSDFQILRNNSTNMKRIGRYGQSEHEIRRSSDVFDDRLAENELVEGYALKRLKALFKSQRFDQFQAFCEQLRGKGWAGSRIDAVVRQATVGKV